jgi:hypothetical protein
MAAVSEKEKADMMRFLSVIEGNPLPPAEPGTITESYSPDLELAGAGQVTRRDIDAMANVLSKLNDVTKEVVSETRNDKQLREAVRTQRNDDGVKVGSYQIMIKEDEKRIAGKQYYSIYHSQTGDVIADDLTLYETALSVVKLLNNGKYVNHSTVRKLFEADDKYTACRTDAIMFKRRAKMADKNGEYGKVDMYESRYQSSVDSAMAAKREIKQLISESKA